MTIKKIFKEPKLYWEERSVEHLTKLVQRPGFSVEQTKCLLWLSKEAIRAVEHERRRKMREVMAWVKGVVALLSLLGIAFLVGYLVGWSL